jgi:hypothetical protein
MKKPNTDVNTTAGRDRDGPEGADQVHVELDADEEQQDRDAELGKKFNGFVRSRDAENCGPAMMPTTIKLTISGWRNNNPTAPTAAASTSSAAISLNTDDVTQ